jgi:hypothetical protein
MDSLEYHLNRLTQNTTKYDNLHHEFTKPLHYLKTELILKRYSRTRRTKQTLF